MRKSVPVWLTAIVLCVGMVSCSLPSELLLPDLEGDDGLRVAELPDLGGGGSEELPTPDEWRDEGGGEELAAGCAPGAGCFLDPCTQNEQCQSGWCVEHMGDGVCTQLCQEECPAGWSCRSVGGGPDVIYACVSNYANLCRPCGGGADCKSVGGAEDVCVVYGEQGSFCGGGCVKDGDCPWGFSCVDAVTTTGAATRQCLADAGVCPCTARSISLSLATPCATGNQFGECAGQRLCTPAGLSNCDAPVASPESCNGEDDDCDGAVDEPLEQGGKLLSLCDDGNPCTEDLCLGSDGCQHVELIQGECLDGDSCTIGDHCEEGTCVGTPIFCDDYNPCTDNLCNDLGGCYFLPNLQTCDDGDPCTVADQCQEGSCAGYLIDCDCTIDSDCLPLDDGNPCNGTLHCNQQKLPFRCEVKPGTVVSCAPPTGPDAFCQKAECNPQSGQCETSPNHEGLACNDGEVCTVGESCNAGQCGGGVLANCNDGNPCTDDSCKTTVGCLNLPVAGPCSDYNACTIGDQCQGGGCVAGPAADCADGNPCTGDSCDPVKGCLHQPLAGPCNDGNACTTGEQCQGGLCQASTALDCDDSNPCTDDSCDPKSGCLNLANQSACSDGNGCTIGDLCQNKLCKPGVELLCNDGNPCTTDSCNPESGCLFVPNTAVCDDGNKCTLNDKCSQGTCLATAALDCDDDNQCTTDKCAPTQGCLHSLNSNPCDDGNLCTAGDHCHLGDCIGGPSVLCQDQNPCTDDSCDPAVGCLFTPNQAPCNDGSLCTVGDQCANGWCLGSVAGCDDQDPCTNDWCDPALGCKYSFNSAACTDGDHCTINDLCVLGQCLGQGQLHCDDGNICTTDSCQPATGCQHSPNTLPCDDSNQCTTTDQCLDGKCIGSGMIDCEDGNICTTDQCDPGLGCHYQPNTKPCSDNDACTVSDNCSGGLCQPGTPLQCADNSSCTQNLCDPAIGCHYPPITPCCGNGTTEGGEDCDGNDATKCPGQCGNDCKCPWQLIHNTVAFNPSNTAGGCSYNGSHAIKWQDFGKMTWKQCAIEASKRGAMMHAQAYTVSVGWHSHRNGGVAMNGIWPTYQQADIGSSQSCILARDPHATINNSPLSSTVEYDGWVWRYQDFGTNYYDQCQTLAGNAGAMIITPYTIGKSGDNYWLNSVHMCNTYEWITGSGTSFGKDDIGAGARSSQHACMVGYPEKIQ